MAPAMELPWSRAVPSQLRKICSVSPSLPPVRRGVEQLRWGGFGADQLEQASPVIHGHGGSAALPGAVIAAELHQRRAAEGGLHPLHPQLVRQGRQIQAAGLPRLPQHGQGGHGQQIKFFSRLFDSIALRPVRARFFPGVNAPFTTTLSSPVSSLVS